MDEDCRGTVWRCAPAGRKGSGARAHERSVDRDLLPHSTTAARDPSVPPGRTVEIAFRNNVPSRLAAWVSSVFGLPGAPARRRSKPLVLDFVA